MARVIVIVGLMLVITTAMFALTKRSAVPPGEAATEPSATVHLNAVAADESIDDAASLASAGPRSSSAPTSSAASAQDVAAGRVPGVAPSFGTGGVDHKGNASFTGSAAPGDAVTLLLDGKSLGGTKADDKGAWTISIKAPAKESQLQVSAQDADGNVVIGLDRAIVRPSSKPGDLPRVTLKTPDEQAAAVKESETAAKEAKTGLIVEQVTGGADGQATLTGKADAGATVKASINGKPAGETQVAQDGVWSLAAANASRTAGKHIGLELLDKSGATLDQTNVPFDIGAPPPAAAASKLAANFSSVLTSKPQKPRRGKRERQAVVSLAEPGAADEPRKARIIKVRRGDSLWRISRRHLGNGKKWAAFYKANKAKIDNPDLIFPGQTLILPG